MARNDDWSDLAVGVVVLSILVGLAGGLLLWKGGGYVLRGLAAAQGWVVDRVCAQTSLDQDAVAVRALVGISAVVMVMAVIFVMVLIALHFVAFVVVLVTGTALGTAALVAGAMSNRVNAVPGPMGYRWWD
jgi:hypothetical protein